MDLESSKELITMSDQSRGAPEYVAPEQYSGPAPSLEQWERFWSSVVQRTRFYRLAPPDPKSIAYRLTVQARLAGREVGS